MDYDVHHGQGTQQLFYNDPRVLYFSTHRFDFGTFWPRLRESNFDAVGDGAGKGFNINVPMNKNGMTNADYLAVWQQVLLPVALEVSWKRDFIHRILVNEDCLFFSSIRNWSLFQPGMMPR